MSDYVLRHHGIKGQKWGIRRFQNSDGTRTDAGKKRYKEGLRKSADKVVSKAKAKADYNIAKYDYKISKDRKGKKTETYNELKNHEKHYKHIMELGRQELNDALNTIGQVKYDKSLKKSPEYKHAKDIMSEYRGASVYGLSKEAGLHRIGSNRNFWNAVYRNIPNDGRVGTLYDQMKRAGGSSAETLDFFKRVGL